MLKSSAGNDQSVQTTTCAICGRSDVFTIVNSVVRAVVWGDLKSTSKYGSSSVAAGAFEAMSHVSSLFVDVGSKPLLNVAFGAFWNVLPANAVVATSRTAKRTMSFLISSPKNEIVAVKTDGIITRDRRNSKSFSESGILARPCRATRSAER